MAEDTPGERRAQRGSHGGGEGRRRDGDQGGRPRRGSGEGRPRQDRRDGDGRGPRSGADRRRGGEHRAGQGAERRERRGAPAGPRRDDRREERRERPAHNPRDLRAANRVDQERSPDIDPDVTGLELDRGTLKEVNGLAERPASWVAKHLVMAGRYIEVDPALAFQHALAASRKGGRLSRVREAVALTAYAAGEYADALREFRTYRRMTGDDTHVAAQVDSERALGRPEKALQLAAEVDTSRLDRAARVELAMVVSGIREDAGDLQGAHDALQIPELDRRRGYPFSPRLFQRQADVLLALGRTEEARGWGRAVHVAEKALGIGGFADPEIVDVDAEPLEDERDRRPSPRERRYAENAADAERSGSGAPAREAGDQDAPVPSQVQDAAVSSAPAPTPETKPAVDVPAQSEPSEVPEPAPSDETEQANHAEQPEQPAPTADAAPPAAVGQPDEVDPNQMSLFDELDDAGEAGR